METELAACPVCGSDSCNVPDSYEGTVNCHGATCCYGVWTVEEHNTLARRAEIGDLVERMCRNGSLDGPLKVFPSRLVDGPVRVSLATCASGVRNGEASTLLDALRALVKECQLPEKP